MLLVHTIIKFISCQIERVVSFYRYFIYLHYLYLSVYIFTLFKDLSHHIIELLRQYNIPSLLAVVNVYSSQSVNKIKKINLRPNQANGRCRNAPSKFYLNHPFSKLLLGR